ncbi:MAG: hypothetical protein K0Q95_323 [Bacteroidota bacterium]|jgi:hypothetical protein|nr:hypothetical protein [Bacteroidota bacterium]
MKKSTLLAGMLALGSFAFGQSQRLVLEEEFTQASCGPCASQNPAFNTLLANNTAKTVSIKYQTNWPGVDPMNTQTQAEVGPRVTYYSVSGVPDVRQDGVTIGSGAPSAITQTVINNEYAVTSPFTINLSHNFSSDYDSIFITCVITASQAFTATGALKAHIVMVERTISFTSAPGTNGETEFYNVMRKMYPNASGTTIGGTWTAGQTQTITFARPVPSYIYRKAEIGIVGFIQDDGNKSVKQAAFSAPQPIPVDIGTTALAGIPLYQCASTFTPTVTVKNFGTNTLTSCDINFKIDNGTVTTIPWTGSLATGATATVTLPAQTTANGSHTFTTYTSNPNGTSDNDAANNQTVKQFAIIGTGASAPLVEGYQLTTFPPAGWFINNPDSGPTWTRRLGGATAGGFAASTACAKIDFYNSPTGAIDEFYTKNVDLTNASGVNLTFSVAHARYNTTYSDKLEVKVSTDCGATWSTVYNKAGATLSTTTATTSAFTPSSAAQWRAESVSLASYIGQPNVMIKFVATSDYGNNAYIDDINITNLTTGINEEVTNNSMNVYPNPMTNNATVNFTLAEAANVNVVLVNSLGQIVVNADLGTLSQGEQNYLLNAESLSNGLYFLNLQVGKNMITKKVSINK